jgi:phosphate transport system permease protein
MGRRSRPVPEGRPIVPTADRQGGLSRRAPVARRIRRLRWLGRVFHGATGLVAAGVLGLVGLIAAFLVVGSWPSIVRFGLGFLTGSDWDGVRSLFGAGPAIAGTLITSLFALLLAVPVALGVAIFLSEIAPAWLRRPLTYVVDLSAAIPSVVYGFWAFIVLVPIMRSTIEPGLGSLTGNGFPFSARPFGLDILTATIVLAVMIIPTIAAISRESLRAVPRIYRESALSLGSTRWEATRIAVLGPARSGIAAGIILGLGRAIGETIAVTMVIGNIYILPGSLFSPGATLATWLVNNYSDITPGLELQALLELALILLAITIAVNVVARALLWRLARSGTDVSTRFHHRRTTPPSSAPGKLTPSRARRGMAATEPPEWRRRVALRFPGRISRRRGVAGLMVGITVVCLVIALAPFASIVLTATTLGGPAVVRPSFYTSLPPLGCNPTPSTGCSLGGIGPEIQGTMIMLALGALIAVPLGVLAGIYLSEYGRNRFGRLVSFFADVMTGIPTIILGLFVFVLFLYLDHGAALSALSGGVALGVLMTPIVTRATEEALRSVPDAVREAALALGFPRHRVSVRVVLGSARGALVTGVLLAASRAAGDTATLLFTAGFSSFWFTNLNTQTAAITPFIFENFGSSYSNLRADAWGAALVLLALMLLISLVARLGARSASDSAEVA